mmetsp:Transcript_5131/g.11163  ORF Transcript_5131/g.11163 Transcript_5131/m.11163 type:complete len:204 (-) Transcript_5131:654-1265(-)
MQVAHGQLRVPNAFKDAKVVKGGMGPRPMPVLRSRVISNQRAGRTEPFNEGAAQVKRLISRDRKEFLGNEEDILDKYKTEFGDAGATSIEQKPASSASANPFASGSSAGPSSSTENPFKTSTASPFGAAPSSTKPFKSSIEPRGLSPDMGPDPIVKETPLNLLQQISITQVVIFFSFTLIIGLMLSTFYVVLNAGGVRLAGLD